MKTSPGWLLFIVVILVFYIRYGMIIRERFVNGQKMYTKSRDVLRSLESSKPQDLEVDLNTTVIVYNSTGELVFVDTTEDYKNNDGKDADEDQIHLFEKMANEKILNTTHVIDDYIYVISAGQIKNKQYCVITYTRV